MTGSIWQQGSVCSAMLGDMGARVIKIEQRGTGDPGDGWSAPAASIRAISPTGT
ncbi:MAG: CoA transferase [Myxococcota bacterium]